MSGGAKIDAQEPLDLGRSMTEIKLAPKYRIASVQVEEEPAYGTAEL